MRSKFPDEKIHKAEKAAMSKMEWKPICGMAKQRFADIQALWKNVTCKRCLKSNVRLMK